MKVPTQDWYPVTLAGLTAWHANFALQAAATGTTYGLTAGQVLQIGVDSTNVAALINYTEVVDDFGQAYTQFRNILLRGDMTDPPPNIPAPPAIIDLGESGPLPGIEERTRLYAGIIRADQDYTLAIGELYGIVGAEAAPVSTPGVVAVALTQSQVQLNLYKAGYLVLAIDSRRGNGAWEQIGVATVATYLDARPPLVPMSPEVREYRVQGIVNNVRTGPMSAVTIVSTNP